MTLIAKEIHAFRSLPQQLKGLLLAHYLFLAAYPLLFTFINAYLWRYHHDLSQIILYYIALCVGLPVGFYLNGLLLQRIDIRKLFFVGAVAQGICSLLIVYINTSALLHFIGIGFVFGVGQGLYWGNKNMLSLKLSMGDKRLYYTSLETAGDMIINMIVPLGIGLIFLFAEQLGLNHINAIYKMLMVIATGLLVVCGVLIQRIDQIVVRSEVMVMKHVPAVWHRVRAYNMISNLASGAAFALPAVLVLKLVGEESALGILAAVAALLAAISAYTLGRRGKLTHIWLVVLFAYALYFFSTMSIGITFSSISVIIFSAISTIYWALSVSPTYTLVMEVMDKLAQQGQSKYAMICDNEIFFNVGRISGLLIPLALTTVSTDFALRYTLPIIGVIQLIGLIPLKNIGKSIQS